MANIREHCSWVHNNKEDATKKAIDLVRMMVEKVKRNQPLTNIKIPVTKKALVIGGGVAGIQAALDIANGGIKTILLDKEPSIGGHMSMLDETFPTLDCSQCILTPKMVEASQNPNIECIQTLAKKYDMVIMKHCYPGSAIKPNTGKPDVTSETKTLENYKEQYRALRSLFDSFPGTKFMIWTLAPLHRMATTPEAAGRAREFVEWVKNDWLKEDNKPHPNIYIFDFFCHLAELDANPAQGVRYCLRYDFERDHSKGDSHPNLAANKHAGPLFVKAVTDAFYPAIIQP